MKQSRRNFLTKAIPACGLGCIMGGQLFSMNAPNSDSFNENGIWGLPVNLGPKINSSFSDFGPSVSPDGKYIFFSSFRSWNKEDFVDKKYTELIELYKSPLNGYAAIYWVDAKTIKELLIE